MVLEKVKKEAVKEQYRVYYNLLTSGCNKSGSAIIGSADNEDTAVGPLSQIMIPCYPSQEAKQIAFSAAKTIGKICEDAIKLTISYNYEDIAEERARKQTEGNLFSIEL